MNCWSAKLQKFDEISKSEIFLEISRSQMSSKFGNWKLWHAWQWSFMVAVSVRRRCDDYSCSNGSTSHQGYFISGLHNVTMRSQEPWGDISKYLVSLQCHPCHDGNTQVTCHVDMSSCGQCHLVMCRLSSAWKLQLGLSFWGLRLCKSEAQATACQTGFSSCG